MPALKCIPLHGLHEERGARFVDFAGWDMPVQYTGILEEHRLVREAAGMFDVSHMGEFRVSGPQALAFLDTLVTHDVQALAEGRGLYTPMCNGHGGVVDDLILYRTGPEEFLLVVNASNREKDWQWIEDRRADFDCRMEDESDRWVLLALQGPRARDILARAAGTQTGELPRFGFGCFSLDGHAVKVARTGYTGEDGFEIFVESASSEAVALGLERAGAEAGLRWAGLGSRDSLRLEAGFPLYGHEISENIDPLSGGIGWTVKWKKQADFVGKQALEAIRAAGPPRRIIHFTVEDRRMARAGMEVRTADGERAGVVVSAAFSPILNAPIGSALLESGHLDAEGLHVELRGRKIPLTTKKPPLHRD